MQYKIKNIELAPNGDRSIKWVEQHMPVLMSIRERFSEEKPFKNTTIGVSLHIEAKTAALLKTLKIGGATLVVTGSNPLSTKDEVAASLAKEDINIFAWRGETEEEYNRNIERVLEEKPTIIIDDGADLISALHSKDYDFISEVRGGAEETTTGVNRLLAMKEQGDLKIPVLAVNDTPAKKLFDNRFGTGESTINAIMSITNSMIAGKHVVVIGYGFVGKGIALRAKGIGAKVTVVETDPIKALEASMRGYEVTSMKKAAKYGDIFVTATGNLKVIRKEHFRKMKDGAILCNSGHFNVEIDLEELKDMSVEEREILEDIQEYKLEDGRRLHVLAEGRLVNLAGEKSLGHPAEIMDMSFALQALTAEYVLNEDLEVGVYEVPSKIDHEVAKLKLEAMGSELEEPTKEQIEYLKSWKTCT